MMKKYIILSILLMVFSTIESIAQSNLPLLPNGNEDGFVVIAHRGASAYAPENTHSAFKLAIEMNAEMIEIDVLLSKDGIPIIIHEDPLERTTDGIGNASDYKYEELAKLDAGSWFDEQYTRVSIPTLESFLAYVKDTIAVNIEIKHEAVTDSINGGIVEKTIQLVEKYNLQDQVIFSSFDYRVMLHLEKLAPELSKAILYEPSQSGDLLPSELIEKYQVDAFNFSQRLVTDEWIKDLTTHEIPFFIYTVNDPQRMKELIDIGASGIFSDKPDLLKHVVENM